MKCALALKVDQPTIGALLVRPALLQAKDVLLCLHSQKFGPFHCCFQLSTNSGFFMALHEPLHSDLIQFWAMLQISF